MQGMVHYITDISIESEALVREAFELELCH